MAVQRAHEGKVIMEDRELHLSDWEAAAVEAVSRQVWERLYLGTWTPPEKILGALKAWSGPDMGAAVAALEPGPLLGVSAGPSLTPLYRLRPDGDSLATRLALLQQPANWARFKAPYGIKRPVELRLEMTLDPVDWHRHHFSWTLLRGDAMTDGAGLHGRIKETGDLEHDWETLLINLGDALEVLAELP